MILCLNPFWLIQLNYHILLYIRHVLGVSCVRGRANNIGILGRVLGRKEAAGVRIPAAFDWGCIRFSAWFRR